MGVVFRTPQKLCLTQLDRHKQQRERFLKNKKNETCYFLACICDGQTNYSTFHFCYYINTIFVSMKFKICHHLTRQFNVIVHTSNDVAY